MAFEGGGGALQRRRARDQERARDMKQRGEERRIGRCCVCYAVIGNDTFGGYDVLGHFAQHCRGYSERRRK